MLRPGPGGNNPLNFIDPSGLYEVLPNGDTVLDPPSMMADGTLVYTVPALEKPAAQEPGNQEAAQVGAAAPPVDVGTTGSSSGYVPEPVATAPTDWTQHRVVQAEGGFLAGLSLGLVPYAGVGQQFLDVAGVLPRGTPHARVGLAIGQMVGGVITMLGGIGGEVVGGLASTTGIGAALGVPAIVVSSGVIAGGAANVAAGARGLFTTGSGSGGAGRGSGRTGGQERLKQIAEDPNTSSADRGWIKQEQNSIERGQRTTIRNPPGKQLAHTRGREASKGYDHLESPSDLQDTDLHKTQHKFDDFGRANKERP